MKRQTQWVSLVVLGAVAAACHATPSVAPGTYNAAQSQAQTIKGRKIGDPSRFDASGNSLQDMMVEVRNRTELNNLKALGSKLGFTVYKSWPQINAAAIRVTQASRSGDVRLSLKSASADILSVQPAQQAYLDGEATAPNDPNYAKQYGPQLLEAPAAWAIQPGKKDIVIAVVDTGVDITHPDLKDRIIAGYNANDPTQPPTPIPGADEDHGTHVAGIAAATANNGIGGVGIAAGVSIMPVKVLGSGATEATIADGVIWAADHGANVITMSLGLYKRSPVFEKAVAYALGKGVTVTASAGNNNAENDPEKAPHLPSTIPGVIEVAATDSADKKASFSNYGKTVSVAAPGVDIISTMPGGTYAKMSGTSMAAPHAAGVAALILSNHPTWKPAQVKAAMEKSSKDIGTAGFDPYFGFGRLSALNAVQQ